MKLPLLIGSAFVLATSAALAGVTTTFADLDADQSGGLSLEEVQAISPNVTQDQFTAYDQDQSGELSESEFDVWKAAQGQTEPKSGTPY